jgi:hypothetical protein
MQVGTPGNIDKGFCLKCKTPLVIEVVDSIQILCQPCVKDIKEIVAAAKGNPNVKRDVIMPGTLPSEMVEQFRKKSRR